MSEASSEYAEVTEMFRHLKVLDEGSVAFRRQREAIIERGLPLAEHIARRYGGRGEPFDDLVQAARVGLLNAVNRFDVENGSDFLSFAVPTMMGEVRRHFRDYGWAIKVPRRVKELQPQVIRARAELSQRLGRAPNASEIADHLGIDRELVVDAAITPPCPPICRSDPATTTDRSATPSATLTPTWTRCSMLRRYAR